MEFLGRVREFIPAFELACITRCLWMKLAFVYTEEGRQLCDMSLAFLHERAGVEHSVTLGFEGARAVCIPEIVADQFQLVELSITDVSERGLEGLRYQVCDEVTGLRLFCQTIRVLEVADIGGSEVLYSTGDK